MKKVWRKRDVSLLVALVGVLDFLLQFSLAVSNKVEINKGVSFGLFEGVERLILFLFWGLLFIWVFLFKKVRVSSGWVFLLVGGLVNLASRFWWGGVIDYLHLPLVPLSFNLSDVLIVVGAFLLCILGL